MARVEPEPGAQRPHLAALLPDLPEHARLAERAAAGEVAVVERAHPLGDGPVEAANLRDHRRVHSLILVRDSAVALAGYRQSMHRLAERLPMLPTALRAALIVFVLAAIFGPYEVRSAVPVWIAFLVALGLEINFFLGALGRPPAPRPDRGPQEIDRELYGYRWPFEEEDDEEDDEVEEALGFATPVRQFLLGVAVIGALRPPLAGHEPNGLGLALRGDEDRGAGPLLAGGLDDRGEGGARPLRRVGRVRRRRPARRRRGHGRRRPHLPDARALPRPLPPRLRRRGDRQPDRPGARRARARGVAPQRGSQRGRRPSATRSSPASRSGSGSACPRTARGS